MTRKNTKTERENFQFRVTKEEKIKFNYDAKEAGMNATDYFKWLAFKKSPRIQVATPMRYALINISSELGSIRGNVNQISNAANDKTYYSADVKNAIVQTSVIIGVLSDKILDILQDSGKPRNVSVNMLIEFSSELKKSGIDCNQIAKAMNDKSYFSVTIKETVIVQIMDRIRTLSNQISNLLESDNERKNTNQRNTTGKVPANES